MVALLLSIGIAAVEAVRYGVSTCYAQITKQQTDVFGKCKSYMHTKLTVTSAPCGSPCSTEPAAYPRVVSSKSRTFAMGSTKKVRVCSHSQDHSSRPVCAGRSYREDLADTQAIHFL